MNNDPTRDEMEAALNEAEPTFSALGEAPFEEIEREAAIYWFAANYHKGRGSNLFRVLQESEYRPAPSENGPRNIWTNTYYRFLELYFLPVGNEHILRKETDRARMALNDAISDLDEEE